MYALLKELCLIPAPSFLEDKRAEFCKNWLVNAGAEGVYIDDAKNVIFPLNCENSNRITVVVAHTDTVFPDVEPMPYREENGRIYCPGVGDDTASVVHLLLTAKFFIKNKIVPKDGVLFVWNSCEEGLGNLMGTRAVMKAYAGRVKQFLSFDSFSFEILNVGCVGSHRYEVETQTEGGHSFSAFGNRSAALSLAEIITEIYKIEVPQRPNSKTTYNVGRIEGGTSVNTIPQSAKMLCEYRSNDVECLAIMKERFEKIFANANTEKTRVLVKQIGERPCADKVNENEMQRLVEICRKIVEEIANVKTKQTPASTDCNIPLSLGIPALCIPTYNGAGAHTREESVEKASLVPGLEIAIKTVLAITESTF
jgi:acetylornithine deacetylase/succinyl-diaminopimelate desuccinylase-like protein